MRRWIITLTLGVLGMPLVVWAEDAHQRAIRE